jgi:hypothetical protein
MATTITLTNSTCSDLAARLSRDAVQRAHHHRPCGIAAWHLP